MNDKVNYGLVGAFVLALGSALVAGVLWLAAGLSGHKQYATYQSIVHESVAGLSIAAPVKYLGVDVGKVSEIAIDPSNSRQVRLRFSIEQGTPIKQNTESVLMTQGLTGIAYVELGGGTAGSPPLIATVDTPIPTIVSKPSLSTRLESVITSGLASLDRVSASLNAVLDVDNRAALKSTLADVATLTHALADQRPTISAGLTDAARTAHNAAIASERITPMILRIDRAALAVDEAARSLGTASASASHTIDSAAGGVQTISAETLPALQQLLGELSRLSISLQRLSEQTARSPNALLLGVPPAKPGPGEDTP